MGLRRHKNKRQSPIKLKMMIIWVLGRNKNEKNYVAYLTAHADNLSNTTQISHNTATRIYRDNSCADDTPLKIGPLDPELSRGMKSASLPLIGVARSLPLIGLNNWHAYMCFKLIQFRSKATRSGSTYASA